LVEADDQVAVGVEPTSVAGLDPTARTAVQINGRLAGRIPRGLPEQLVAVADGQHPGGEGRNRREHGSRLVRAVSQGNGVGNDLTRRYWHTALNLAETTISD
jgi:hypothetical protein